MPPLAVTLRGKVLPVGGIKELRDILAITSEARKLADTPIEKVKFSFEPTIIIFEDGTKLEAPDPDK